MKKFKRMIALLTVAVFLLGVVAAPAAAATKEEAFGRLNALSVAVGDQNGDPQYDKNFTRAEAAAIMVNLSGMNAAIEAAKGKTNFKDVPATHWASGVINLATGAGIIKGYGNNIYKPDQNVTYAEMSAMLVGVLGYTPKLQGVWPSNVIGKAAQLGLLDGVSVTDYNAAAVRSNVFLAADNALDVKPLKETKDGYEEDTKSLMENKLNVTKKAEGIVTVTPNYGEKDKVTVDPTPDNTSNTDSYTVTLSAGVNGNDYYGEKVVPWVKDDKAFFLDRKNPSDVIKDKLVAADSSDTKIFFDKKDRDYLLADTLKVRQNFNSVVEQTYQSGPAGDLVDSLGDTENVKAVLNSEGKVAYIEFFTYTQALVKDVNATDEKINIKAGTPSSLDLKNDTYTIVKNGKVVPVGDVKTGDVLDVAKNTANTKFYIYANDKTVTGKVESITSDSNPKFTIGGTQYKSINVLISTNNGDSYTASASDVQGKNVTAKLNKDGKIAAIVADAAAESTFIPVYVKSNAQDGTVDKNVWVKVAKIDGTNTSYQVTKDTKVNGIKVLNGVELPAPTGLKANVIVQDTAGGMQVNADVYKIELTADGKVKEFKTYAAADRKDFAGNVAISKTNDTLGGYKVNSDAKFAYQEADGDWKSLTWGGVESLESSDEVDLAMTLIVDKGVLKYGFITETPGTVAGEWTYGVVKEGGSYNATLGDAYTIVYVNGEQKTYKVDWSVYKEKVVEFKIDDGEMTDVSAPAAATINSVTQVELMDVDEANNLLKVKAVGALDSTAVWVSYNKDIQVYSGTDKKDLAYAEGKTIELYDVLNDKNEKGTDLAYDFALVIE